LEVGLKKGSPVTRAATFTLLLQAKIDPWLNNHSRYFYNNNPPYKVAVISIFAYYFTMNKQFPHCPVRRVCFTMNT
jgi:hypothetical protein